MTRVYTFKASPYSSHSLLLAAFPREGHGRTVLDVGCGSGYLGASLAERGFAVTGIERPDGYSKPFPASVRLVEADLEHGLPDLVEGFDYVLCADILEHLRDPGRMLRRLHDVVKPGGTLIASLPNSGNVYFRLNILAGRFPQDDKGLFDRTHVRFYMWTGLGGSVELDGLERVRGRIECDPGGPGYAAAVGALGASATRGTCMLRFSQGSEDALCVSVRCHGACPIKPKSWSSCPRTTRLARSA